jgi:CHAD domain-containing protein
MPVKAPQLVFCRNESVSAGLRHIVDELIESAIACIKERSREREEDLHQVRLAIKRLRAILRLLQPLVSKTFFKRENARLRSAARRLARLRDLAVARRTLEQVTDKLASHSQDAAVLEVFESFLAQTPASSHYDEDREAALGHAGRALAQTHHAFHALPLPDRGWKTIEPGLKKLYRQNRTWMKCASSSDKDEDFHEWRKNVKHYFYLLKMLTPMWPSRLGKTVKHLDCLQDKLGKDHDLAVLKSFLVKHLTNPGYRKPVGQVIQYLEKRSAKFRKQSVALGKTLFDDKPRHWMKALRKRWKDWQSSAKVRGNRDRGASAQCRSAVASGTRHRPSVQAAGG